MVEDKELIRQYAASHSEAAFAQLVNRHLKMVYAAALRQVNGDSHLAEDVAQLVFADLARKARKIQSHVSIAGWLYASTRFTAANVVRAETRRRQREQTAVDMNEFHSNPDAQWAELQPVIDDVLARLKEDDREAIVLRFFESLEFSLVGAALGISESGARMKVERALEKVRGLLQQRGFTTTSAALGGALTASSAVVLPAHLAVGITTAGLAHSATGSITSTILKIIAMKKLSLVTAAVIVAALTAVVTVKIINKPSRLALALGVKDGVRTVEAKVKVTLAPGETLLTGGWLVEPGKRCFVFVTPGWIDARAQNVPLPQGKPPQIRIDSVFIEGTEEELTKLGLDSYFVAANTSQLGERMPSARCQSLVKSMKSGTGADILTAPRMTAAAGVQCSFGATSTEVIQGKKQTLGPWLMVYPAIASDGKSIDLEVLASDRFAQ